MTPVADDDPELAFEQWLGGLTALTGSAAAARQWRERRYAFAHRPGEKLVGESSTHPPITGSAVYGIWLKWGLLYVGQINEASRRLRDLPVGESHHLANTFPPEIWDRVVVIDWPSLAEAKAALAQLDHATIGLALEHRLQVRAAGAIGDLADEVDRLWDIAAVHKIGSALLPAAAHSVRPGELLGEEHAV